MTKRMIIMLIVVGVILGGVFGFEVFRGQMIKKYMAGMGGQPQTVSTAVAKTDTWDQALEAVGSLRAAKGADLSSEIAGIVDEIHFDSGGDVKAGTLLVKLRDDDDIARLHSLEAAQKLAQITYDRDVKLLAAQAVSQATLDSDSAALASDIAQVREQEAIIEKKHIKAPFSGHLGIRQVDIGQYMNPGTAIVTLQALDPIYLDFYLPQQALSQVKIGQKIAVKNDTYPGRVFEGSVSAINPRVDTATRNVQIRATLPNDDKALLPGMYATAVIDVGAPQKYVTLPQTAITYNPYGNTVFTVDGTGKNDKGEAKLTAKQTFVTVGQARGDQVAILKGVDDGQTVVTSGQIKLQNGSPIVVNNTVTPTSDANPQVKDQ